MNATKKKKASDKKKRHDIGVGDLVMFHTLETHMFGTLGEVTHVLSKDQVVARCLSPSNTSFSDSDMHIVLHTFEPKGHTKGGDEKSYFTNYVTRVIHQAQPKPVKPKQPRPVTPPRVIESADELIEHLAKGDSKERIIIAPTATEKVS